jgi:hypothetical protein
MQTLHNFTPAACLPASPHFLSLLARAGLSHPRPLTRPRPATLQFIPHSSGQGSTAAWLIAGELHSTPTPGWRYRPAFFLNRNGHHFNTGPSEARLATGEQLLAQLLAA